MPTLFLPDTQSAPKQTVIQLIAIAFTSSYRSIGNLKVTNFDKSLPIIFLYKLYKLDDFMLMYALVLTARPPLMVACVSVVCSLICVAS
jgi:hypothetical protein